MKRFFTLLTVGAMAVSAMASVPSYFKVSPEPGSTVSEIRDIVINYSSNTMFDDDVWSYSKPDVRINNIPMEVTYKTSGSANGTLTYTLKNPITLAGEYTIFIGEASFWFDELEEEDNPEMSWNVTVANEGDFRPIVNSGVRIVPEQGTYTSLQYFQLIFDESYIAANTTKTCYLMADDDTQQIIAEGKPSEGAGLINGNVDLSTKVTAPGTYILVVPEGAFYSFLTDDDFPEYRFRYVIDESGVNPEPEPDVITVEPAESAALKQLDRFVITFEDYTEVYENSAMRSQPVDVTDSEGVKVATASISLRTSGLEANQVAFDIEPAVVANGTYHITIPARRFVLEGAQMYDGQYSSEINLTYTVDVADGMTEITIESVDNVIYRLDGTRVQGDLPAGIYIINGKKTVVK